MDDEALRREILSRFPEHAILEVKLQRHGDRPTIEPGSLHVTLVPRGPEEYNADPRQAPQEVAHQVVHGFLHAYDAAFEQLRKDLPRLTKERVRLLSIGYGREGFGTGPDYPSEDKRPQTADDERLRQEILSRFPESSLLAVEFERHDDRPDLIAPGEVWVRLIPRGPEEYNANHLTAPQDVSRHVVYEFHREHDDRLQQLRKDLPGLVPERFGQLAVNCGMQTITASWGERPSGERGLTAVMARLNQEDLETLDTLIAAGLAPSRAEAVRWSLARIRERPAFLELQQRVREIERLKAEF